MKSRKYKHFEKHTLKELKYWLSQPLSENDLKRLEKMDNQSQGLLNLNLLEMQRDETEH